MVALVTYKNEEDSIKLKVLECSPHFSHYKSKGIFLEAQVQLTPQSVVRSGQMSNLFRDFMDVLITGKNH